MSTLRRPRTAIPAVVAVLTFALAVLIAVNAEGHVITENKTLVAEDQVPARAPVAGPTRDETFESGAIETRRAAPDATRNAASGAGLGSSPTDPGFIDYTVDAGQEKTPLYFEQPVTVAKPQG